MENIEISCIRTDGGCQPRSTMLLDTVEEYANEMARGAEFPPVVVFYDGADYWLADGYHRREAAETLGLVEILADVRQGTRRDAILFSVGANAAHGLRRTNEDKRRAVLTLLNDAEWKGWSDRDIARQCAVSHTFVQNLRPRAPDTGNGCQYTQRTFIHPKTGAPTTMNTSNIGRAPNGHDEPSASSPAAPSIEPPLIDLSASHLWQGLRDAIEAIKTLPGPEQTVEQFPRALEHAIRAEDVTAVSQWLSRFAVLWNAGQNERDERMKTRLRRAEEIMKNVAI